MDSTQLWNLLSKAQPLTTFSAGLLGLLAGAYLSRRADRLRQLEAIRSSAYADFLRGAAGLAAMNPYNFRRSEQADELLKFRVLTAEAKARIAIYGSSKVIKSLAEFIRQGGSIDSPKQESAFVALCSQMRADSILGKKARCEEDISCLLFDPKPPGP